ncbi:MAG: threonine--tRNA ligase [Candidatus Pacebacteria bacterium]|nr:threonine--tRNA ligase [Candidatus Paceibacterota bacterium]MBP9772750.1 threonine--tRNA ligase [Candidatus Paceibacterota bacterium]
MNEEQLHPKRHTLAHLLGAAVLEIYPGSKLTLGPSIEDGFYYDIDVSGKISEGDLSKIEDKMRELLPTWTSFSHKKNTPEEAKNVFANNEYKSELIDEIAAKGEDITLYTSGTFTDLCRGGHVENPSVDITEGSWKLDRVAGAYWRGSEKNKMLTRIYGLAFESKEKLDEYLNMREEAQKRDHRKIGQEQKLFFVDEMVGKGLIMWQPNGTIIRDEIEKFARTMESDAGYVRVVTPHLAKEELFLTSGHLPYYKDDMYPAMVMDDGTYYLKAMNCPHHHIIFRHEHRSYRDLPVRLAEYGTVYRNELSGTLAGLLRVRCLAMNDAHIYCRKDQIRDEFKNALALTMKYFEIFGLKDYWFRLSLWDPERKDKYVDEPENWNYTEGVLRDVLVELGVKFIEVKDEAAFYGPKVDIQFKSVIGRTESMSTVQLDFIAKKRFELSYVDETGKVNDEIFVIHRAPLSTHERFTAFLIEHYAGIWPTWLAPVQVRIVPVSEKFNDFSMSVLSSLKSAGVRADLDGASDTLGKRIRNAKTEKVPYVVVIGEKEVTANSLTIEKRSGDKIENISVENFVEILNEEISTRKS